MKKYFVWLGLAALFSMFIVSCGNDTTKNGDANNSGEKITLEWWHFWTDPAIKPTIEQMVADYEQAHPNVTVNMTDLTWANGHEKIVVAFSSGTAPDIIELGSDWVPEFSNSGQLADITQYVKADTSQFLGWSPALFKDRIYAQPWILGTRVLFINRGLIKQTSLDSNFVPINWDDLKKLCFAIDSLDKNIYGFGSNAAEKHRLYKKFMPFFWSMGGRVFGQSDRYAGFAGDQAYKALEFYKMLTDSCSLVDTQRRLEDAFLDGKIGVIISGDWLLKRIRNENRNIDFITSIIPGPKYPGKSFLGGEYLAVAESSAHKKAASDFIKYITAPGNQVKFCKANYSANPSSKTAAEDPFFTDNPNLQTFVKQIRAAVAPPNDPRWVDIEALIEGALEKVLFEGAPIAETLYETNRKIQEYMDSR